MILKTQKISETKISFMLPTIALKEMNQIISKMPNMTKNQFIFNLFTIGLGDVQFLDSVGLLAGHDYTRGLILNTVEKIKGKSLNKKINDLTDIDKISKTQLSLVLPTSVIQDINNIVVKIPNMTKNQFMSNLIMMGLDDAKILDNLGLVTFVECIRTIMIHTKELFTNELQIQTKISFKK